MGRRTLLLIASILVAALGTTLIWLYVQGADSRAEAGQALIPVLFASRDVPAGTPAEDVPTVTKRVPAEVGGAGLRSLADVHGQQLANPAVADEMLLRAMFSNIPTSGVANGRAAVSITVSDPHRVAALLKPGSVVAVYATAHEANGSAGPLRMVDPHVKVLAIGSSTAPGTNGQPAVPLTIVTFDVSAQEGYDLLNIETYGDAVLELLGQGTTAYGPHG
jgi:pilus assembly protein CpaB